MKTQIEIYGKVLHWEKINDDTYLIILKEDETNKEWEVLVMEDDLHWYLDDSRHFYVRGEMVLGGVVAECADRWGRICSHCGKHHTEGYYSENTGLYACSDECLTHLYTEEEIMEEREQEWLFWTEWE